VPVTSDSAWPHPDSLDTPCWLVSMRWCRPCRAEMMSAAEPVVAETQVLTDGCRRHQREAGLMT